MALDSSANTVRVRPQMILGGLAFALLGGAVLGGFLWMLEPAAAREVKAACIGLQSTDVAAPLCTTGEKCALPMPAPEWSAVDHNGKQVKLSDFRGKVVLVNFWASWCGVCKMEKPTIDALAAELGSNDFVVVTLASDRNWQSVLMAIVKSLAPQAPLRDKAGAPLPAEPSLPQALELYSRTLPNGVPFSVYLDPPADDGNIGAIAAAWGIKAVPESFLIDRKGNIRAYFVNKRDWTGSIAHTCIQSVIDE